MNVKSKLNIASVIGVRDGIEQIFSLINECLESYSKNTEEIAQIESCQDYVHQLNSLLEMLELSGLVIVGQEMEKLIEALTHKRIQAEPAVVDILMQASYALSCYLNELIRGIEDNPLRLYSTYRNLRQAQGARNVYASDLFVFHRIAEPPVMPASSQLDVVAVKAAARQIRTEYQAGLLKWLRDTTNQDGLYQMTRAVRQIECFPGPIEQRLFWWVCIGFMDSLLDQESVIDLSARKLCGKIEQEIRRLVEDTPANAERLMREVLYQIASSYSVSDRIKEIRRTYEWPLQFASEVEAQQAILNTMHETLAENNHSGLMLFNTHKQDDGNLPDSAAPDETTIDTTTTKIDPELLDIFLEEAEEVLTEMSASLQLCRQDLSHVESLTTLRRGFHIIKGSAHMVKLQALSEVARNMEQVMDHWLGKRKPVTRELIDLATEAHLVFSAWCNNLQQHGITEVNSDELLFLAKNMINNVPPDAEQKNEIMVRQVADRSSQTPQINSLLMPRPIPPEPMRMHDAYDDINLELWQLFFEEARAPLLEIKSKLRAWRILPQDSNIPKTLLKLLHTLKESAHMAGAVRLGELMRDMEAGIERVIQESVIPVPMIERLTIDFEEINEHIVCLQNPSPTETRYELDVPTEVEGELPQQKSALLVNAELIDHLVSEASNMNIVRSRIEAQLYNFRQSLLDLNESLDQLRVQLHEVENQAEIQTQSHLAHTQENNLTFDPTALNRFAHIQELTRLMAGSVSDMVTVQQSLCVTHSVAEEVVAQQSRMHRELQQKLMRVYTAPFGNIAEQYYCIVRQTALDLNKKAELCIQGDQIEIDRNILEKINKPLEHLLRNAVAHGVETSDKRSLLNKSETGQITINLCQEGNEVLVSVSDDGSGLDISRIYKEAVGMGLIQNDEVLDDNKLMSLIFERGLTTRNRATDSTERGIGMDVVKNEIAALGGRIEIDSEINKGTTFHIYLPLSLVMAQTLLIRAGDKTYAVPAKIVAHIHELNAGALNEAYQNHRIEFNEKNYPFAHLSHLFGERDQLPEIKRHNRLLLLHDGVLRLAIHVDELLGRSEVVAKNIGAQLAHAPGVEGAAVAGNEEIILIINPIKLMQREEIQKIFT